MAKILVVDDEQTICWGIERLGTGLAHQVFVASSAEQGLRLAVECQPDLLILDVRLPGVDGITAMSQFRRVLGRAPIIVITAFGDLSTAVKAVQNGAFEYLLKPFDLQEIRSAIQRALLSMQAPSIPASLELEDGMVGKSPLMQEVFKRIALAAAADVAVLLEGEPGVGKATAAQAIHRHSSRGDKPFVCVNLSAHDAVQAERELFGCGLGLDSNQAEQSVLRAAQGGTLFLEDVSELPPIVQIKLARVLETRRLPAAPPEAAQPLDVRIIAATSGKLIDRVQRGMFRLDLFHKLSEFEISLPAVRDRPTDIPLLARCFASQRRGTSVNFAEETMVELMQRKWHGNVRELRSVIEHAIVVARAGLILKEHLPPPVPEIVDSPGQPVSSASLTDLAKRRATDLLADPEADGFVYEKYLEEVEPALLESAMSRFAQECAPAARALGLHRTTLKRKLDQYKLGR